MTYRQTNKPQTAAAKPTWMAPPGGSRSADDKHRANADLQEVCQHRRQGNAPDERLPPPGFP